MLSRAILLVATLLALFAMQGVRVASSHALLERADPPLNATLREAPTVLTLYFSEPLERRYSSVSVTKQDGTRLDDQIEFDDANRTIMRVRLKPVEPGYLNVSWENVSTVDGHRITGSYPLTILNPDGSTPPGSAPASTVSVSGTEVRPGFVVAKFLVLIAAMVLIGLFVFAAVVIPALPAQESPQLVDEVTRIGRLLGRAALMLVAVATVLELWTQSSSLGSGISSVLTTRWGERLVLRDLCFFTSLVPLLMLGRERAAGLASRTWAFLGVALSAGALAFIAMSSHAAAGEGALLATASDFIHLLVAGLWIGVLIMLVALFHYSREIRQRESKYQLLATALSRSSAVALVSLLALLLTGVINALIEVHALSDLLSSAYGRVLLAKLVVLLPLLFVAAYNAYVLRPDYDFVASTHVERQRPQVLAILERRLYRSIRREVVVALAILAITAFLTQLNPTRGGPTASVTGKFTDTREMQGLSATLVVDPNQPGTNTFEVYLAGATDTVESLRLNFASKDSSQAQSRLVLEASNPPTFYVGRGPYLFEAGAWNVSLTVRRNSGADLDIPFDVAVQDSQPLAAADGFLGLRSPIESTSGRLLIMGAMLAVVLVVYLGSVPSKGRPAGRLGQAAGAVHFALSPLAGRELRPIWSLTALVILGAAIGIGGVRLQNGTLFGSDPSVNNPVTASADSIERGRILFATNCIQCHGETGKGDGPLASSLPIPPANLYMHIPYHPDEFFFAAISNGLAGVMPSFKDAISEDDRWRILTYLRDEFGQPEQN